MHNLPQIRVAKGDVAVFSADVLALKFAQAYYGADKQIMSLLTDAGENTVNISPEPGSHCLLPGRGVIGSKKVLLVGVNPLTSFGYENIREFARRVLSALWNERTPVKSLAVTLHGPGYGLDEVEALESMVAGFFDAINTMESPDSLREIVLVERDPGRFERLGVALQSIFGEAKADSSLVGANWAMADGSLQAGRGSDQKPHVFVAMPFAKSMNDLYHYGIQGAVREAGFLCERADHASFTGDVLQWVRKRISSSALLIADLTDANPNVYLEVGFAWGCRVPTVLLVV